MPLPLPSGAAEEVCSPPDEAQDPPDRAPAVPEDADHVLRPGGVTECAGSHFRRETARSDLEELRDLCRCTGLRTDHAAQLVERHGARAVLELMEVGWRNA